MLSLVALHHSKRIRGRNRPLKRRVKLFRTSSETLVQPSPSLALCVCLSLL